MDLIENYFVFSIEKALSIPLTICFFLALKGVGVVFGGKKSVIYLSPFIGLGIIYTLTLVLSVIQPGLKLNFLPYLVLAFGGILYYKKIRQNFFGTKFCFFKDVDDLISLTASLSPEEV